MKKIITVAFISLLLLIPLNAKAAVFKDNQVVDSNKSWTIHFNSEVSSDNLQNNGITVTDSKGNNVNVNLSLGKDNKSIIVNAPSGGYAIGQKYQLTINNKIHNKNNSCIKQEVIMNFGIQDSVVTFKDKNLEKYIRSYIDKPTGDLLKSDVEKICDLSIDVTNISDISGIENCTNLESLYLYDNLDVGKPNDPSVLTQNAIKDLSPLKGLTKLRELSINKSQVSDISALKELTNLQELYLSDTRVSDISALKELTNLKEVDLSSTQVSDINALEGLTNLKKLVLWGTKINSIDPLKNLDNLTSLSINGDAVKNINALSKLTNLTYLEVANMPITDISALKNLTNLQYLDLCETSVNDISPLKELTNLKYIDLECTPVGDINALKGLTNLQELRICATQVKDISPLKELSNLENISLDDNNHDIVDSSYMNVFKSLSKLQHIYVSRSNDSDIKKLGKQLPNCEISMG